MFRKHGKWTAAALAGGLAALFALVGCGGGPSVASKSASAFREAQKRGETFEDAAGSHGHGASSPSGGHDEHAEMEQQEGQHDMAGMDHGAMGHQPGQGGQAGMAGMDHHGATGHQPGQGGMAGMDHGAMGHSPGQGGQAGMDHGAAPSDTAPLAASSGQPAKTLSPDPLDSPVATSVLDAQRSADMNQGMEGMDHGGHGQGTYRQIDAGRTPGASEGSEEQAPGAGPHQHGQATPPPPGQQAEAVYTCPMHPEVTSKTPGKCPKCGMTLVERRKR